MDNDNREDKIQDDDIIEELKIESEEEDNENGPDSEPSFVVPENNNKSINNSPAEEVSIPVSEAGSTALDDLENGEEEDIFDEEKDESEDNKTLEDKANTTNISSDEQARLDDEKSSENNTEASNDKNDSPSNARENQNLDIPSRKDEKNPQENIPNKDNKKGNNESQNNNKDSKDNKDSQNKIPKKTNNATQGGKTGDAAQNGKTSTDKKDDNKGLEKNKDNKQGNNSESKDKNGKNDSKDNKKSDGLEKDNKDKKDGKKGLFKRPGAENKKGSDSGLSIPDKRSDAIRKSIDAGVRSGNGYSNVAQKALNIMDAVMGKKVVDALLDRLGDRPIKKTILIIVNVITHALLPIFLIILGIYMVFTPMLDAIMELDKAARSVANFAEKFRNLYKNGNFADSKTAFYEELKRLEMIYGDELNSPLLLATTFYPDMVDGYDTRYDNIGEIIEDVALNSEEGQSFFGGLVTIVSKEIDSLKSEADSTYDEQTGLMYTTGKVYRLKSLADHMFSSTFLGDPSKYDKETVTLDVWIKRYSPQLMECFKAVLFDVTKTLVNTALALGVSVLLAKIGTGLLVTGNPIGFIAGVVLWAVAGIITIYNALTTKDNLDRAKDDLRTLINCMYMGLLSIVTIDLTGILSEGDFPDEDSEITDEDAEEGFFSFLSKIKVTYYKYQYNEENYKEYLRQYYIPKNPDFDRFLTYDALGHPSEASINRVINEIFDYETYFRELFYDDDDNKFSEKYSEQCLGAIDKKLASMLTLPTDINPANCVDFSGKNGYGYNSSGLLHNGIELNATSTGNKEGDSVYSVMDNGTVKQSSADNTFTCNGGCLEIEYEVSGKISDATENYKFSIVYKGLSKDSVTLKTGDKVTKRQQVGTIGTAAESENMDIPSLYIEFRNEFGNAIDPTNLIVKCSIGTTPVYEDGSTVTVPQYFTQTKFHTVTCYGGKGWFKGCKTENEKTWGNELGQNSIYKIWAQQDESKRYRNGIAIINVDGIDRYLAAATSAIGAVGTLINVTFKDGTTVPMIIADQKNSEDGNIEKDKNGTPWGHHTGSATGPVNIIEMEVDKDTYNSIHDNVRTTTWGIEWDTTQPIVSITRFGKIIDDKFNPSPEYDFSGSGNASTGNPNSGNTNSSENYISSSGLKLCYAAGTSSSVEKYVSEAINMANNDKIGYSQTKRNLDPDVDCSSFVYYSLVNSGVMAAQDYAFNTATMGDVLKANGFDEFDYDINAVRKGDILVNPNQGNGGHATIYIGDKKEVAAHSDKDGKDGDGDGSEVSVRSFTDLGLNYEKIYRIKYDPNDLIGQPPNTNAPGNGTEVTKYTKKEKTVDVITVKTSYMNSKKETGPKAYAAMLKTNGIRQNLTPIDDPNSDKKYEWSGCCRGVAKTQACGYMRGSEITLSSVESRFNSSCDSDPPECAGRYTFKCFPNEAEMTAYVINRINQGKLTLLHVSTGSIKGLSKEEFNKKTGIGRHFLTAVGYVKGSDPTDSTNLMYIDSFNAEYGRIGERMYILKTSNANYNGDSCPDETPYHVVDFD